MCSHRKPYCHHCIRHRWLCTLLPLFQSNLYRSNKHHSDRRRLRSQCNRRRRIGTKCNSDKLQCLQVRRSHNPMGHMLHRHSMCRQSNRYRQSLQSKCPYSLGNSQLRNHHLHKYLRCKWYCHLGNFRLKCRSLLASLLNMFHPHSMRLQVLRHKDTLYMR
jgi:hypothetical protein